MFGKRYDGAQFITVFDVAQTSRLKENSQFMSKASSHTLHPLLFFMRFLKSAKQL